jgi:hypothetical protein
MATPCTSTDGGEEGYTLHIIIYSADGGNSFHVHTAGGRKGYTLQAHKAGGGKRYTVPRTHPARPYCGLAKDIYLLNDVEQS